MWQALCRAINENPKDESLENEKKSFYTFYSELPWPQREQVLYNLTQSRIGRRTPLKTELKDYLRNTDKPHGHFLLYALVAYRESLAYTKDGRMETMLRGMEQIVKSQILADRIRQTNPGRH